MIWHGTVFFVFGYTWLDRGRGSIKMGNISVIVQFVHIIQNSMIPESHAFGKSTFDMILMETVCDYFANKKTKHEFPFRLRWTSILQIIFLLHARLKNGHIMIYPSASVRPSVCPSIRL